MVGEGENGSEDAWEVCDKVCDYMAITNQTNIEILRLSTLQVLRLQQRGKI